MSQVRHIHRQRIIDEQAAHWLVKIDNQVLAPNEEQAFRAWLTEDDAHRAAFIELAKVWGTLDILNQLADVIPLEAPVADKANSKPWPILAMASIFVLVGIVALLFVGRTWDLNHQQAPASNLSYKTFASTDVGQQKQLQLPDGSTILLNTDSNLNIHYSANERAIYLNRGEAHFQVAYQRHRPFVVYVAQGKLRAVGTAFSVSYQGQDVDVIVTEGIVAVDAHLSQDNQPHSSGNSPSPSPGGRSTLASTKNARVTAGQQIHFDQRITHHVAIAPGEMQRQLAWHKGMLSFSGQSLQHAVNEVSRYTDLKIVIGDPTVAELPVGGYFKAGETQALFDVLELSFGIKVSHLADGAVLLSRGENFSPN